MPSNYDITTLDEWLGVQNPESSVTASSEPCKPLKTNDLAPVKTAENDLRLQTQSDFPLRGKNDINNKYMENGLWPCNSVTGDSAGRIVPPDEVLASANLARQRNRRDRDLIALMHASNVIDWTWIEHNDGRWTAHHSRSFESAT
jgi:hypothetical protein